jgi:hypothetical protein
LKTLRVRPDAPLATDFLSHITHLQGLRDLEVEGFCSGQFSVEGLSHLTGLTRLSLRVVRTRQVTPYGDVGSGFVDAVEPGALLEVRRKLVNLQVYNGALMESSATADAHNWP